ncbi:MAG: DUF4198 domain-containing protein [Helicobacter sp.]|nr:DUF4198 domain-containing protein [Helicobacter sp.]
MKYNLKTSLTLLALGSMFFSANAHRVWIATEHAHGGDIIKADLGYGHFPKMEEIRKDRLNIFKPLQIVTPKGTQELVQSGKNYQFQTKAPVDDGSYLILAQYKPTYWSKSATGWKRANLQEHAGANYCEQTQMFGKHVINVGHDAADTKLIGEPVGQNLEIVPLDNPANIKVNKPFKVQVLYKGEPLAGATLTATFQGFDKRDPDELAKVERHEAQAFSDQTDDEGIVSIIPLRRGFWKAAIEHKAPYHDAKICQFEANYATLTFQIGSHRH